MAEARGETRLTGAQDDQFGGEPEPEDLVHFEAAVRRSVGAQADVREKRIPRIKLTEGRQVEDRTAGGQLCEPILSRVPSHQHLGPPLAAADPLNLIA